MENPFEIILEKLNRIEITLLILSGKVKTNIPTTTNNEIINTNEAAKFLSLTKSTLYKYTAERNISHYRNRKKLYFRLSELNDWLTNHKVSINGEIKRMAEEYILNKKSK